LGKLALLDRHISPRTQGLNRAAQYDHCFMQC
jgi:hypothetical protein